MPVAGEFLAGLIGFSGEPLVWRNAPGAMEDVSHMWIAL